MELSIVQIGNSKGIRLSKFVEKVKLILKEDEIILKPISKVGDGWDEAFKNMAAKGEDELLMPDVFEDEEWE